MGAPHSTSLETYSTTKRDRLILQGLVLEPVIKSVYELTRRAHQEPIQLILLWRLEPLKMVLLAHPTLNLELTTHIPIKLQRPRRVLERLGMPLRVSLLG